MTGARIRSHSDRTSVSSKAGVRAATASPQAVAAPFPTPAFNTPAPALAGLASTGSAFSFDEVVDALEADGLFSKNAITLRSVAVSESFSNSKSTVGA
ncbi:hypothetical protein AB8B21_05570 [Tardiphaga sp. 866_E4_N2_1]|uniref:hypothetical protein n=1 Tax=unclassified Tardiphaga TaxID=2631404 RepID=UPI003F293D4D